MTIREMVGLVLIAVGLALTFQAWGFSQSMTIVAFICMIAGALLFYTERQQKRKERKAKQLAAQQYGVTMPMHADIHNPIGRQSKRRRTDSSNGDGKEDSAEADGGASDGDGGD